MGKYLLPQELEEMPNGPHKRDEIRHYKKLLRKRKETHEISYSDYKIL